MTRDTHRTLIAMTRALESDARDQEHAAKRREQMGESGESANAEARSLRLAVRAIDAIANADENRLLRVLEALETLEA